MGNPIVFFVPERTTERATSEELAPTGAQQDITAVPTTAHPASDLNVDVIGYGTGALLEPSTVAPPVIPQERTRPLPRDTTANAVQEQINDGQSRKGYAVAVANTGSREAGSLAMSFAVGPIVNVGTNFGPDYFETKPVSMDSVNRLSPPGFQSSEDAFAAASAVASSRKASAPVPYSAIMGE